MHQMPYSKFFSVVNVNSILSLNQMKIASTSNSFEQLYFVASTGDTAVLIRAFTIYIPHTVCRHLPFSPRFDYLHHHLLHSLRQQSTSLHDSRMSVFICCCAFRFSYSPRQQPVCFWTCTIAAISRPGHTKFLFSGQKKI